MVGRRPAAKFLEHLRKQEAAGDKAALPLYGEHRGALFPPSPGLLSAGTTSL